MMDPTMLVVTTATAANLADIRHNFHQQPGHSGQQADRAAKYFYTKQNHQNYICTNKRTNIALIEFYSNR